MTLHLVLTEDDGDIIFWKESLPRCCFSEYVKDILIAEKGKEIAVLPVLKEQGFIKKRVDTKIYFHKKDEIEIVRRIPKGRRARIVKKLIRKHLRMNYDGLLAGVPAAEEKKEITDAFKPNQDYSMNVKEIEPSADDEMSEEYRQMLSQMTKGKYTRE